MNRQHPSEPTELTLNQQRVKDHQEQEALRQSEEKYQRLFETINPGFARCEAIRDEAGKMINYRLIQLNPAFEKLTGLDAQTMVGKPILEVMPDLDPWWIDTYRQVVDSQKIVRFEKFLPQVDRWYDMTAFYYGEDQFAVYYDDITPRKQAEETQRQSEARLQLALGIAQLGTWSWNLLTNEGYLDDRGAELIGIAPGYQANVAQAQRASIHLDDLARTEADVLAGIAQGTPFSLDYRVVHPDQSVHHIRSRFQVVADLNGRPVKLMGTNRDVTADHELTTTLRQNQEKQAFLLALSDALHPLIDPVELEATAVRLLGEHLGNTLVQYGETIGDDGLIRQDHSRHRPPQDSWFRPADWGVKPPALHQAGQVQVVANVATDPLNTPAERQALQTAHIEAYIAVPLVKQGHWVATLAVHSSQARSWTSPEVELVQETAERTWAALERARTQKALDEANQRKDEFLAMLAHELRNPMATIRSGLQLLTLLDQKDQVSNDTIAMMDRQTDHLVRLVDDLLDVSRISRGNIELKRERLDLGSLVSNAVEAIRPQFETSQKSLRFSPAPSALFVDGDATRLTQVVTNLLTNGLRYTDQQGQVWLTLGETSGEVRLEVNDNGIGLSQDQLTRIFELFVQADTSLARSRGGLGVGLTLAKRLVELHQGRLEASSPGLGQGSTFAMSLPLAEAPKNEQITKEVMASSTVKLRVLVIDDNADAALTLSMLLTLKGYEVHSRSSGRAGIQAAESLRPAIIICDIGMPELDGYATCRLIRGQSWGQSMRLIALTGYGGQEDKQRAQEAGFDGHLVKPVDLGELQALLTSVVPTGYQ